MGNCWPSSPSPSSLPPCSSSPSPSLPPWADLPYDLLVHLAETQTTSFFDLIRFSTVCKSWRWAAAAASTSVTTPPLPYLSFLRPAASKKGKPTMCLYGLCDQKIRRVEFPPGDCSSTSSSWCCWGSSHGWLAMVDLSAQPFLFNPVSGARIDLPSFGSMHCMISVMSNHGHADLVYKDKYGDFAIKLALSAPPTDPNCIAMIIYGDNTAYARVQGDSSWITIEPKTGGNDLIYHGGHFWRLSTSGSYLVVFSSDPDGRFTTDFLYPTLEIAEWHTRRLVSLPCGMIGQVCQLMEKIETRCGRYRTAVLEVLMLQQGGPDKPRWVETEDIGECSILVGCNHTVVVPASGVTGSYMSNCIYVVDHGEEDGVYDIFVFHIKKKYFRRCASIRGATKPPVHKERVS